MQLVYACGLDQLDEKKNGRELANEGYEVFALLRSGMVAKPSAEKLPNVHLIGSGAAMQTLSSTQFRKAVAGTDSARLEDLVPHSVLDFLSSRRLYGLPASGAESKLRKCRNKLNQSRRKQRWLPPRVCASVPGTGTVSWQMVRPTMHR